MPRPAIQAHFTLLAEVPRAPAGLTKSERGHYRERAAALHEGPGLVRSDLPTILRLARLAAQADAVAAELSTAAGDGEACAALRSQLIALSREIRLTESAMGLLVNAAQRAAARSQAAASEAAQLHGIEQRLLSISQEVDDDE